jgi:glycosyltransferase involved in cell wall biosynthesis
LSLKILHIIPGLTNASGPTQALLNLIKASEAKKAEISVAYLGNRLKNQIKPDLRQGDVFDCQAKGLKHWGYSPQLRALLAQKIHAFDIVHLHSLWLYPGLAGSRAARKHNIPYIVRPAGSLDPEALLHKSLLKRLYFNLVEKQILNNASLIHAVSEQEQKNIQKLNLPPPCINIPNGIDPTLFSKLPSKSKSRSNLKLSQDSLILLFLGRFHQIKGLELLIPVIRDLAHRFPKVKLVLAGPDQTPFAAQLKSQFRVAGISPLVQFLGELDEKTKINAYRAADLFLLPSRSENFGIVAAEAMAAETPVIASNQTPWEIVEKENAGDWIDRDPQVWTETIARRLESKEWLSKAGTNGRRLVLENFSWPKIGERMIAAYHQILENSHHGSETNSY